VIVLVVLVRWDRARPAPAAWIVLGALLPWLPYAAYVAADLPDWRGQTAGYANRFELLNPAWYLDNLAQEYHRYGPGLGPPGLGMLLRVGFWSLLVALPGSLAALTWRALRCGDAAARAIVVPAILLPLLFAALIHLKLVNYTLLELPLEALAVAWGTVVIWRRPGRWPRLLLAALVLAVCTEGTLQLLRLEAQAAITTPYAVFAQRVRQYVPDGAHVLGLHTYWFGFEDLDYRSFLVPLLLADEGMPLDQALDTTAADTLLLDDRLRAYFAPSGDASAQDRQRFESWLQRHDATRVGAVNDPTYGLLEVYHLQP
jgi:hypothetical protein